jgi:ABC-2 type transport system permease protein
VAVETTKVLVRRRVPAARFPGLAPVGVVARRAGRGALLWGGAFGLMVWSIATQFAKEYPTAADRARLVMTMGADVGSQAIFGAAHHLDTVAGYTAYHVIALGGLIGAVWGLLAGTRLLRGEEEAGRWELLLAGQTTRRRAAAGALAGLGAGLLAMWAATAAITVVVGRGTDAGFSTSASLFLAVAAVAAAGMFLAVGAVCGQLAATRRQAAGLAAAAFGVAYLLRAVAATGASLRWLRWASPLGWVDELRPLTGSRPLPLLLILAFTAVLATLTIELAGRRDLGAGVLPANDAAAPRTRLLNGPLGLAARLNRGTAIGWLAGLGALSLVLALSTRTMQDVWANQQGGVFVRLAGANQGGATYLGLVFLVVTLLVAMAAAGQVAATREEEAEGYLDHLLARPVARLAWLAGRFAVAAALLAGGGVLAGLLTWVGASGVGAEVRLATLLAAGVNAVPAGILVLGAGTLVHGLAPRFAAVAAYGLVAWSLLVEVLGGQPRCQPLAAGPFAAAPRRPRAGGPGPVGRRRGPGGRRARRRRRRSAAVRPSRPHRCVSAARARRAARRPPGRHPVLGDALAPASTSSGEGQRQHQPRNPCRR